MAKQFFGKLDLSFTEVIAAYADVALSEADTVVCSYECGHCFWIHC